jgi:hypothetical protein
MKKTLLTLSALALMALAGCSSPRYERTEVSGVVSPVGGELSTSRVRVPVGGVIKANIAPWDSDGKLMEAELVSTNPEILAVKRVAGSRDVLVLGVRSGVTTVMFMANGTSVHNVQAEVVAVQ